MCLGALKAAPTRALAGDLVLQGVGNGCFPAYGAATGARLWRFNAAPIRWAVNRLGEERPPFEPDIVAHWDGVSFGSRREALAIARYLLPPRKGQWKIFHGQHRDGRHIPDLIKSDSQLAASAFGHATMSPAAPRGLDKS